MPATATARAGSLTRQQRAVLHGIARATWRFYAADVDPTDAPAAGQPRARHRVAAPTRRPRTSGCTCGRWSRRATSGLIDTRRADQLARATLGEVARLKRYDGMLYQWYDTNNGKVLRQPRPGRLHARRPPSQDNCWFVSAVDNGWYASGLIEVRQALPAVARSRRPAAGADELLDLLRQQAADPAAT